VSYEPIVALKTSSGVSHFTVILDEWCAPEEAIDIFKRLVNNNRKQILDIIASSAPSPLYFDGVGIVRTAEEDAIGSIDMEANTNEN
jgi:hypothetical protein